MFTFDKYQDSRRRDTQFLNHGRTVIIMEAQIMIMMATEIIPRLAAEIILMMSAVVITSMLVRQTMYIEHILCMYNIKYVIYTISNIK